MEMPLPLGEPAPDFTLPDLQGYSHSLSAYRGRLVVLSFWSAECPWSARADQEILPYLETWGARVAWLPVASNANEPLELLAEAAHTRCLEVVLWDAHHQVADLYAAQTTPHLFVIDQEGLLRYQGAFDDVTFRQRVPRRGYLVEAVTALLSGRLPEVAQSLAYGCTIVRIKFF